MREAGKGDTQRPTDHQKYSDNYELTFGKKQPVVKESLTTQPEYEPAKWMYPDALCDKACLYLCTKGFTQFPECATSPTHQKPMTDEMRKQTKERCDSMEMRGAFADGWLSAEAAHGIKE